MATPNQAEIQAIVVSVKRSDEYPDKWYFQLELTEATPIGTADFVSKRLAQKIEAFTFAAELELTAGDHVSAKAEYLGGARAGVFQLTDLKKKR